MRYGPVERDGGGGQKQAELARCLVGWLRPPRPVRICTDLILPHYFITDFFAVVAEPILAKSAFAEVEKSALRDLGTEIATFR